MGLFESVLHQPLYGSLPALGSTGLVCEVPVIDTFMTTLDGEFLVDGPLLRSMLPTMIATDPAAAAEIIMATAPPPPGLTPDQANVWFERWLKALKDSTVGAGNVGGNVMASVEAALRAYWRREAATGFQKLLAGDVKTQKLRLGKHITVTTLRVGKGGELRRGAKVVVRTQALPTKVVQSLNGAFMPNAKGTSGTIRMSPQNLRRMDKAAMSIADARIRANTVLRSATGKVGGGVLAFGPSAAIDAYDAYTNNTTAAAAGKDFLVRSAKSQSGNVAGVVAGVVAVAVVGAVGAPAIVLALGVGIVAQTVWTASGADVSAAELVKGWLD